MLAAQTAETTLANGKAQENEVHVSVAANETVGTSDGQTIMIIHEDQLEQVQAGLNNTGTLQIAQSPTVSYIWCLLVTLPVYAKYVRLSDKSSKNWFGPVKIGISPVKIWLF